MEDLNQNAANLANEENVTNDELQTVVQQEAPEAVANDSDTNETDAAIFKEAGVMEW